MTELQKHQDDKDVTKSRGTWPLYMFIAPRLLCAPKWKDSKIVMTKEWMVMVTEQAERAE